MSVFFRSLPVALFQGATLALALMVLPVQAQVYRCETDSGVPLYQNNPGPKCKAMDLPAITTIPAPRLPAAPAASPSRPAAAPQGTASAPGSSAGFPRVESQVQRSRDLDRRRILDDELRKEESRLSELKAEYNAGEPERRGDERNYQRYLDRVQRLKDDIARTESGIGSLRREIAALRD